MSLKELDQNEIDKLSLVDLAYEYLIEENKEFNFLEIFNEVAKVKGLSESEKEDKLAQFYTDLNIDVRFTALGSNNCCLKRWYPNIQLSEKNIKEANKSIIYLIIIDDDEIILTEDTEYKELGFEDDEIEKDAEAIETEEEIE